MVNITRAARGSGMEHPIGNKASKTAARTRDIDTDIDPHGDVLNVI